MKKKPLTKPEKDLLLGCILMVKELLQNSGRDPALWLERLGRNLKRGRK